MSKPPRILVLAGLDPSGRAGLLADGETVRAFGCEPILCATAITAQSSARFIVSAPVPPELLRAQVDGALEDGPIAAVKIGMLGNRRALEAAVGLLRGALKGVPAVVDPVLESSRGGSLFEGAPDELLPLIELAELVTPNVQEGTQLSGTNINDEAVLHEAASRILLRGARAVLLKGGHLPGAPVDLLLAGAASGVQMRYFRGERIAAKRRGTGCRLASAIAAGLAVNMPLERSVERAIGFVRRYLAT
jgi:hydroxymethylpyrimidine/phosphomethylpyrimidine kinase